MAEIPVPRSLSLVIPTLFNRVEMGGLLEALNHELRGRFVATFILVDDSGTSAAASAERYKSALLGRDLQGARILILKLRRNYGQHVATLVGLHAAWQLGSGTQNVVTLDDDGQHSAEIIVRLVDFADERQAVFVQGVPNGGGSSRVRSLQSRLFRLFAKMLCGTADLHSSSALRVLHARPYDDVSGWTEDTLDLHTFLRTKFGKPEYFNFVRQTESKSNYSFRSRVRLARKMIRSWRDVILSRVLILWTFFGSLGLGVLVMIALRSSNDGITPGFLTSTASSILILSAVILLGQIMLGIQRSLLTLERKMLRLDPLELISSIDEVSFRGRDMEAQEVVLSP